MEDAVDFDQAIYYIVGDSHVARIDSPWHRRLVQTVGFRGADTKRLKQIATISRGRCRQIVVVPGANDALNGRSPTLTTEDSAEMIMQLATHTDRLTVVKPFRMPKVSVKKVDDVGKALKLAINTARLRSPNTLIEVRQAIRPKPHEFAADQVHLTPPAQHRLAMNLQGHLHAFTHDEEPRVNCEPTTTPPHSQPTTPQYTHNGAAREFSVPQSSSSANSHCHVTSVQDDIPESPTAYAPTHDHSTRQMPHQYPRRQRRKVPTNPVCVASSAFTREPRENCEPIIPCQREPANQPESTTTRHLYNGSGRASIISPSLPPSHAITCADVTKSPSQPSSGQDFSTQQTSKTNKTKCRKFSRTSTEKKRINRERKAQQRYEEKASKREARLCEQRERAAALRGAETASAKEARLCDLRERSSARRAAETMQDSETRLTEQRERSAARRESETAYDREARLQDLQERSSVRRDAETAHVNEVRLTEERERSAARRNSETAYEREARLHDKRERSSVSRDAETAHDNEVRLTEERERSAARRNSETAYEREARLHDQRERSSVRRDAETAHDNEARLTEQRERSAVRRNSETAYERKARLHDQRERSSVRRDAETAHDNEVRLTEQRERSAARRNSETAHDKDVRLHDLRERSVARRDAETPHGRETRLTEQRERLATRIDSETPHDREARLIDQRDRSSIRRAAETPAATVTRLADLRARAAEQLEAETAADREVRLAEQQQRYGERMENETPTERDRRLAADAESHRQNRMARLQNAIRNKSQLGRINDVAYFEEGVLATLTNGQLFQRLPPLQQPSNKCEYCGAYIWRSGGKNVPKERPGFCCEKGKIPYEQPQEPPEILKTLYRENPRHSNKSFLDSIRAYNNSLALASLGCNEIRMPGFSPTFKIQGKVYHSFGSLIPAEGNTPSFAQIYFNDTEHEVENRLHHNAHLSHDILQQLQDSLRQVNRHIHNLKMAVDYSIDQPEATLVMQADTPVGQHERRYNLPSASEVAVLLPGEQAGDRDIVIQTHEGELTRIKANNPFYDPLHYVLLFPYGTSGYTTDLPHTEGHQGDITPYEFYRVKLQIRDEPDNYLLKSRRLMQQYVCDQEAKAENIRLKWYRENQKHLKAERYRELQDAINSHDERRAGTQIVLPPSFTGGPRWYAAKFQDAMAIVREKGKPSAFVTITCNPKWPEITENLNPGESPSDRPDLCVRVFHLKLAAFIDDLDKEQALGRVVSYLCMKEDQKRGLPHAHILLIFADADKLHDPETVNRIISAEIPDPDVNPELHAVITANNIHGPCGELNTNCSCMKMDDGGSKKCSKNYPKRFQNNTIITDEYFPEYRRRSPENGGRTYTTNSGHVIDNRWIVPYNPYLSAKYKCHINVEFVHTVGSVKYLYKYICKGSDRVMVRVDDGSVRHDEIQSFEDARYIGCTDGFWRIYEFPIQLRYPAVEQLPLHLEDNQIVIFTDDNASAVAAGPSPITKLTAFFELNRTDPTDIKYPDVYRHYTWGSNKWVKRKNRMGGHHRDPESEGLSETIGRIPIIAFTPRQSELYFLRMLLYHKRGPSSYADLRTVEGEELPSFQEACRRLGFLTDDTVIDSVMEEIANASFGPMLRDAFTTILIWITPADCEAFWLRHQNKLCEDLMRREHVQQPTDAIINEVLLYIQENVEVHGLDLKKNFKLPLPDMQAIQQHVPREIRDEVTFDHNDQQDIVDDHLEKFNDEQRDFYDTVMTSVINGDGKIIGLDAPGGYGKTFCLEAILASTRREGRIALATATSGIAATLLPNGRTLHSRFKVPINIHESSSCPVSKRSATGHLITHCQLLVIDEVTMAHRHVYECVDRTFRFIREDDRPFGGATVILSGDWRQILPVVRRGSHADILHACLKKSPLWDYVTVIPLTINMRVQLVDDVEQNFAKYLLDIGDGRVEVHHDLSEYKIRLPDDLTSDISSIPELCQFVFEDLPNHTDDPVWLCSRAILCPTNKAATEINKTMLRAFPGESQVYKSADKISDCPDGNQYPQEFVNTIEMSGLPQHEITLKLGAPIMLMRNLDPAKGHCNGTRYVVTRMGTHTIEAKVATGVYAGNTYTIPRIPLEPSDNALPFTLIRRQFPIRVCFGMTANKSQGQTLSRIGLYLPKDFFSHGQLYVSLSRVGCPASIKVLTKNGKFIFKDGIYTDNVVFRDILK